MIVFVPTPPPRERWPAGIEFGVLTTMSFPVPVPRHVDKAFVDISLRRTLRRTHASVELHDYAKFVGKVRAKAPWAELWIVSPDAFCDAAETRRRFEKFKKLTGLIPPPKKYVYVAQEFWRVSDVPEDADVVALPARRQCYTNCSREHDICAARIIAYVRNYVRGRRWTHLLGPSLRVLRATHHLVDSFDTASYRRAVDKQLKQMMGGRWQATKDVMELFLFRWLEKANLLGKD